MRVIATERVGRDALSVDPKINEPMGVIQLCRRAGAPVAAEVLGPRLFWAGLRCWIRRP